MNYPTQDVFDFFTSQFPIQSDVEVFHTDLSSENALGFTETNGNEQFIQIDKNLNESDYITTLLHELVHVIQNESGILTERVREDQAYHMEGVLYDRWCDSRQTGLSPVAWRPKSCIIKESKEHHSKPLMRKIETQMNAAIHANANWQSGNTAVYFDETSGVSVVRLHGNKIAEISDNDMTIFDGGWQSTTTKSRLNALCAEFCVTGEGVFQKDFVWYVRKFVGQAGQSKVFNVDDFSNGYVFA